MSTESMHRRPQRGGAEVDALSREGRRAYAWRAGERRAVKVGHNRRVRGTVRRALRAGAEL